MDKIYTPPPAADRRIFAQKMPNIGSTFYSHRSRIIKNPSIKSSMVGHHACINKYYYDG